MNIIGNRFINPGNVSALYKKWPRPGVFSNETRHRPPSGQFIGLRRIMGWSGRYDIPEMLRSSLQLFLFAFWTFIIIDDTPRDEEA